ncbi:MAG: alanine acetyltransferase [Rhodospirillaceae bacterium]|nr:alanine acetyltransferase [Rhodospirillaceae bacterium]
MRLEGSCHCGAVTFSVESPHPYPYMRCYCSICRKTAGTGGYAINLSGAFDTLEVAGEENITVFHARMEDGSKSEAERRFCRHCGTALWLYDSRWPDLVHPHAGAIDTPLPSPPEHVHILLESKPDWVPVDSRPGDPTFDGYPVDSIAEWHDRHGLVK